MATLSRHKSAPSMAAERTETPPAAPVIRTIGLTATPSGPAARLGRFHEGRAKPPPSSCCIIYPVLGLDAGARSCVRLLGAAAVVLARRRLCACLAPLRSRSASMN